MGTTRDVSIWALQDRSDWTPKKSKPFVVRWSVAGRPKSKAFAKVLDADIYRGRQLSAINDREQFDPATGKPVSWTPVPVVPAASEQVSFLAHAVEHVQAKWPAWTPKSRSSAIEGLVIAACALTDDKMLAELRNPARSYLAEVAFNPPGLKQASSCSPRRSGPGHGWPSIPCRCRLSATPRWSRRWR